MTDPDLDPRGALDEAFADFKRKQPKPNDNGNGRDEERHTAIPPPFSDDALALEFSQTYKPDLRYLALLGKWLRWDECHWQFEETLRAFDLARLICRKASTQVPPRWTKIKSGIASARTVAAVERLARADRRHATEHHQWDADPWVFNSSPPRKEQS
jgi:putative DNA primase/helicase